MFKLTSERRIFKVCIAFLILLILVGACKKRFLDHRNSFLGKWDFTYTKLNWCGGCPPSQAVEETFTGDVYYFRKEERSVIHVVYSSDAIAQHTLTVDKNGNINGCGTSGKFLSASSLTLTASSSACDLSMGSGTTYTVSGKKR